MRKFIKRAYIQIKRECIRGAIFYTYENHIIPQQNVLIIFIYNEGHHYFKKDFNFTSQIKENTTLLENISVTKLFFSLSFSRQNIGRNIHNFNQFDFRFKDYLEISSIESDKSYELQRLKMNRSVITIDRVYNKIKDQRIINEKFEEIVHYPTIKYDEGVLFEWTPNYKGIYHLIINGYKMEFKFLQLHLIALQTINSYQKKMYQNFNISQNRITNQNYLISIIKSDEEYE